MLLKVISESKAGLARKTNEDSAYVRSLADGLLAIVCDGLGGNKAGDIASKIACDEIARFFVGDEVHRYPERLVNALDYAHHHLMEKSFSHENFSGMATTAVALYISSDAAYWAHVGDSRLYFYFDGELHRLTKDHSLVQRLLDEGYISEDVAAIHPQKNIITRALGDKRQDLKVDCASLVLDENQPWKFMLCSDGVTNVVRDEELVSLLANDDLDEVEEQIVELIEKRGAPDNFTFIIISNSMTG